MTSVGSVGICRVEDSKMEVDIVGQEDATYIERGMGTVDQNYHQPKIFWRKRSVKVKFKVSSLSPYRFAAHRCCNV